MLALILREDQDWRDGENMQLFMNVFHFESGSCFSDKPERPPLERFSLDIQKRFCVCFVLGKETSVIGKKISCENLL